MSDEEQGEIQENINAQREDINSEEAPWQMQNLHELLSLESVEEYTVPEFQHILALYAALTKVMPSFYEAYAKTFQGIHEQSLKWDSASNPQTVHFSKEFYHSMPTPFEELLLSVDAKIREMQNSNRFTGYDFERHVGNLMITQNPEFSEPRSEETQQKLAEFSNAANTRQDRYNARWEACLTNHHIHDIAHWLKPMRAIQHRSTSSAEDAAEQSRRRMIQASGGG